MPINKSLGSDNHSGIHPRLLDAISRANIGHSPAYGTDEFTHEANIILKNVFGEKCHPHFVFNGTAANVLCLKSLMESHEAVITASTAHLQLDECGAPEHIIGCKILLVPSVDGKLTPQGIEKHLVRAGDQHYAQPKVVSITLPSEYGTCYSLSELKELRTYTREKNLLLHIDGARLIYAAHYLGVELIELTQNLGADAVSFGGTKNGLLFGEIVLIYNEQAKNKFKYIRKQNMQLPSKMRFISCQFSEFFRASTENLQQNQASNTLVIGVPLWREIAQHCHSLSIYLAEGLKEFSQVSITQMVQANSVFVKVPRTWIKPLKDAFFFYVWDEETFELRWMISYDFTKSDIDQFLTIIRMLSKEPLAQASAKPSTMQESH